jgi:hypothetical protein
MAASVISQDRARGLANKIVKPITDKINAIKEEKRKYLYSIVLPTIPKEVMAAYSNEVTKPYIKITSRWKFLLYSSSKYMDLSELLPSTDNRSEGITLDKKQCAKIEHFDNDILVQQEKKDKLYSQIYSTLIGLKTYKRIKEELPDVWKLIEEEDKGSPGTVARPTSTALIVIPEAVRQSIKCLLSEDKKCVDKL